MNHLLRIYYKTALDLKLNTQYFPEKDCLKIQLGKQSYYFTDNFTPMNIGSSFFLSNNKRIVHFILKEAHCRIPESILIDKEVLLEGNISSLINDLRSCIVVKPAIDISNNLDIVCNINSLDDLTHYVNKFLQKTKVLRIEEFHKGLKEYTVLILKKHVIGVVEHFAPSILGDGLHSIKELIAIENERRKKHHHTLKPITMDDECVHCLKDQGLTLESILAKCTKINLSYAANKARGGHIVSLGNTIHRDNAKILIHAANALNLDWVSFDILCEDINQSFKISKWFIIEAHNSPDITLHEIPDEGPKVRVSQKLLKHLIYRHLFSYFWHRLTRKIMQIQKVYLYG